LLGVWFESNGEESNEIGLLVGMKESKTTGRFVVVMNRSCSLVVVVSGGNLNFGRNVVGLGGKLVVTGETRNVGLLVTGRGLGVVGLGLGLRVVVVVVVVVRAVVVVVVVVVVEVVVVVVVVGGVVVVVVVVVLAVVVVGRFVVRLNEGLLIPFNRCSFSFFLRNSLKNSPKSFLKSPASLRSGMISDNGLLFGLSLNNFFSISAPICSIS
jgi:hypothetical protein